MSRRYPLPDDRDLRKAWARYDQARRAHEVEQARRAREASTPTRDIDETRLHISLRNMHEGRR